MVENPRDVQDEESGDQFADVEEVLEAAAERRAFELKDYYMEVKEVSGTAYDDVIKGKTVTLFPDGSMDVRLDTSTGKGFRKNFEVGILQDGSAQVSFMAPEFKFFLGLIKLQGRATIVERGSCGSFHLRWSTSTLHRTKN